MSILAAIRVFIVSRGYIALEILALRHNAHSRSHDDLPRYTITDITFRSIAIKEALRSGTRNAVGYIRHDGVAATRSE